MNKGLKATESLISGYQNQPTEIDTSYFAWATPTLTYHLNILIILYTFKQLMFMVNSSREGTSFWAKHKSFIDGALWTGFLLIGLKIAKAVVDKYDLWCVSLTIDHLYIITFRSWMYRRRIKASLSAGRRDECARRSCFRRGPFIRTRELVGSSAGNRSVLWRAWRDKCRIDMSSRIRTPMALLIAPN